MRRSNSKLPADWRAYAPIGATCPADDAMRPRADYAYGASANASADDDSDAPATILDVYRALLDASESDDDEAAEYADYHSLTR